MKATLTSATPAPGGGIPQDSSMPGSVLVIGTFQSGKGASRGVCEDQCERLEGRGWKVTGASARQSRLGRLADMLSTIWMKRHHYDCAQVEVYSQAAFLWAEASCWLLRRLGKPYVLTLHGGSLPKFAAKVPDRVGDLLRSAQVVTAPSPFLARAMQAYRKDIVLIPNALDVDHYPFRLRSPAAPQLIWLRAFHQIYQPQIAVQVLHKVQKHYPEATLSMVGFDRGDGSLEETREEARRLRVTDSVFFPGKCSKQEVPARLNQGDIFLNTTNVDNTPVSVVEAMACGLCVVSTNVGGIPDLLADGEDALLVPRRNAEAMAEEVMRIVKDPDLARRLSSAGRRKAETMAWNQVLPRWHDLFVELGRVPNAGESNSA